MEDTDDVPLDSLPKQAMAADTPKQQQQQEVDPSNTPVPSSTFFEQPPTYQETFTDPTPVRVEVMEQDELQDLSAAVRELPRGETGYPDLEGIICTGPSQAVTLICGLQGVQGFERGTLGDWTTEHLDYEVFGPAFTPDPPKMPADSRPRSSSVVSTGEQPKAQPFATPDDVRLSRPHPNAFFSPKTHAWAVSTPWPATSLSCSPSIAKLKGKCHIDDPDILFVGSVEPEDNGASHRFVHFKNKVNPRFFLRDGILPDRFYLGQATDQSWPGPSGDIPDGNLWVNSDDTENLPQSAYWSLYVCNNPDSRHQLAVATSFEGAIEMACGHNVAVAFERAKTDNPAISTAANAPTHTDILYTAWELVWRIIDNVLMRNEVRSLPVSAKMFSSRIGWDEATADLFASLGFKTSAEGLLVMPKIDETEEGRLAKTRLTRAWIETAILVLSMKPATSPACMSSTSRLESCFKMLHPRAKLEGMFGGNHIPRVDRSSTWTSVGKKSSADALQPYVCLGCTSVDPDSVLIHGYQRQTTGDPKNIPKYLSALIRIADDSGSTELQVEVAKARSNSHWSIEDEIAAYSTLGLDVGGCTTSNTSQLDLYDDDLIAGYFSSKVDACRDLEERRKVREALDLIVRARKSNELRTLHANSAEIAKPPMTLEKAYKLLQLDPLLDNQTIMGVFTVYCSDQPNRQAEWREALGIIAESRNSKILRTFLETGKQEEETSAYWPVAPSNNTPAGLENIGNTCYLNSLLQYLFTIKALRDVILNWEALVEEHPDQVEKRVGGRIVSSAEIKRSRKFVCLLAELFNQLAHTPTNSIKPEKDLAYLALVTSDDEVAVKDDVASTSKTQEIPETSVVSPSKRKSEHLDDNTRNKSPRNNQPEDEPDYVLVEKGTPTAEPVPMETDELNDELDELADEAAAEEMKDELKELAQEAATAETIPGATIATEDTPTEVTSEAAKETAQNAKPDEINAEKKATPPPLPPRHRNSSFKLSSMPSSTDMMFGRQHDVGECMDNVYFQVDAALNADKLQQHYGHRSIVQSLFFGKTRQTLSYSDNFPPSTKEEDFSSIMVDVGLDGQDLYESLDATFDDATVETEHAPAQRQLELIQAPPILQILLQRVQFEKSTARSYKSNAYMPFPATLSLDRYMWSAEGSTAAERKSKSKEIRKLLAAQRAELAHLKDPAVAELPAQMRALEAMSKTINDAPDSLDIDFGGLLVEESEYIESTTASLQKGTDDLRLQLADLWKESNDFEYELSSVFMHRGEASYGHYWLHQRALAKEPARWLKFNDSIVTDIADTEVFENTTGQKHNPYLLTYVRKTQVNLIEAVSRDIGT